MSENGFTPLQIAQACFMEWIKELEYELSRAKDDVDSAITCGKAGQHMQFAKYLGYSAAHVDKALAKVRAAVKAGMNVDLKHS